MKKNVRLVYKQIMKENKGGIGFDLLLMFMALILTALLIIVIARTVSALDSSHLQSEPRQQCRQVLSQCSQSFVVAESEHRVRF